jgi:hypothetical protein
LGTQLRFRFVIGFFEIFWWIGNSKGFTTSHHTQGSDTFCKSPDVFFFFLSNEGILSATAIATEFAQYSPKVPNFVKIRPKTISLWNFEIPLVIQILIFSKKKNPYR